MRILPSLACLSLLSLLAACDEPSRGYYDESGRYIYNSSNSSAPFQHDVTTRDHARNDAAYHHARRDEGTYTYDRRGYYDYEGTYSATYNNGMTVPSTMFPGRGLCRVWFADRTLSNQPAVESCTNIKQRVPAGAYVIYGG